MQPVFARQSIYPLGIVVAQNKFEKRDKILRVETRPFFLLKNSLHSLS